MNHPLLTALMLIVCSLTLVFAGASLVTRSHRMGFSEAIMTLWLALGPGLCGTITLIAYLLIT